MEDYERKLNFWCVIAEVDQHWCGTEGVKNRAFSVAVLQRGCFSRGTGCFCTAAPSHCSSLDPSALSMTLRCSRETLPSLHRPKDATTRCVATYGQAMSTGSIDKFLEFTTPSLHTLTLEHLPPRSFYQDLTFQRPQTQNSPTHRQRTDIWIVGCRGKGMLRIKAEE